MSLFFSFFCQSTGALPQTLVCPRLSTACPDLFCPFNCAGRGVCNYDSIGVNSTIRPTCECFDKSDTSPGCSDSLIQDGDFLDDADGLMDNIEEDFFDPLVAVFVDHPDKWTTSSWAWGAGLLTIFLVMLLCICSTFWPEGKSESKNRELTKSYRSTNPTPRTASSPSPRKSSSSLRQSQEPRRASSTRDRTSSSTRNHASSTRRLEGRRQASSTRPSSSSSQKRSSSSYHERYLKENHQVVSPTQYHQSRTHGNRPSSSTLAEM